MESLTHGASPMSHPMTCEDLHNATSSPESAGGHLRYALPGGQMTDAHGLVLALANLSAKQAKALGLQTSGIYGPHGCISSASASLQSSLASKLQARFGTGGSILFLTTWKTRATPAGRQYCQLQASARRTSENVSGSLAHWPTATVCEAPNMNCGRGNGEVRARITPQTVKGLLVATLASWPTPTASLADKGVRSTAGGIIEAMRNKGPDLAAVASLTAASWATPAARDWRDGRASAETMDRNSRPLNEQAVGLAPWATPTVTDASRGVLPPRAQDSGIPLTQQIGMIALGSPASMTSSAQLNPAFPRWLMGYPESWGQCSPNFWQWELTQKMLSDSPGLPQGFFAQLARFVISKYGDTAMQSCPLSPPNLSGA